MTKTYLWTVMRKQWFAIRDKGFKLNLFYFFPPKIFIYWYWFKTKYLHMLIAINNYHMWKNQGHKMFIYSSGQREFGGVATVVAGWTRGCLAGVKELAKFKDLLKYTRDSQLGKTMVNLVFLQDARIRINVWVSINTTNLQSFFLTGKLNLKLEVFQIRWTFYWI